MSGAYSSRKLDHGSPLPGLLITVGPEPAVVSVNKRFTKVFGYCAQDLTEFSRALTALVPQAAQRAEVMGWWRSAFGTGGDGGRPRRCRLTAKGGKEAVFVVCGAVVGGLARLHFVDPMPRVAARKSGAEAGTKENSLCRHLDRLRARMRKQQIRMENTLDALVDPHLLLKPVTDLQNRAEDFMVVHANQAATKCLSKDGETLLGRKLSQIAPKSEIRSVMAWARDVLSTHEPLIINDYAHCKALYGAEERYDIRITAVDGTLSWTWRDVTERHKAAQRILDSEEKYRLLAQNSSDVVSLVGKNGRIRWVSPSVTTMFGWSVQDWVGRREADFLASDGEDGEREGEAAVRRRVMVCKTGGTEVVREKIRSSSGKVHWVEVHSGPYIDSQGNFGGIVSSRRLIDQQVSAEEELMIKAKTDELTKLLSRGEALERLGDIKKRGSRTGGQVAVLFVDLDKFKLVNDTRGHAAGDAVLQEIAGRVKGSLRTQDDIGARFGGDEMLVVLHGIHDLNDAAKVADKLRLRVAEPIGIGELTIETTASIGVALIEPGERVHSLIARADDAMYRAKAHGRNRVVTIK